MGKENFSLIQIREIGHALGVPWNGCFYRDLIDCSRDMGRINRISLKLPKVICLYKRKKMETKLYVGNMSQETTEQDLRTMFGEAGTVGTVDVIMDRNTGKPKGFAFVTMSTEAEAEKAIGMYNAKEVNSRTWKVNVSIPRENRKM